MHWVCCCYCCHFLLPVLYETVDDHPEFDAELDIQSATGKAQACTRVPSSQGAMRTTCRNGVSYSTARRNPITVPIKPRNTGGFAPASVDGNPVVGECMGLAVVNTLLVTSPWWALVCKPQADRCMCVYSAVPGLAYFVYSSSALVGIQFPWPVGQDSVLVTATLPNSQAMFCQVLS
jgi:hypothetical protein